MCGELIFFCLSCGAFVCIRICCNKEHLAIFYLSNKQRRGGRVKCLRRSSRVFARKPGLKNGKEAIFEALSGVPLPLHCRGSTALTQRQRLRRPSNPCRAWGCKSLLALPFYSLANSTVRACAHRSLLELCCKNQGLGL